MRDSFEKWNRGDNLPDSELKALASHLEETVKMLSDLGKTVHSTTYYLRLKANSVRDTVNSRELHKDYK